ncbi:MAG: hypothetical protein Q7R92_02575 [bacterium]|nr:hypothetical protein [bacterium]
MAKFIYKIFLYKPHRRVENFVRNYCRKFLNFSLASVKYNLKIAAGGATQ